MENERKENLDNKLVDNNLDEETKLKLEDYLTDEDLNDESKKQITITLTSLIKIILGIVMFGLLFLIIFATYTA